MITNLIRQTNESADSFLFPSHALYVFWTRALSQHSPIVSLKRFAEPSRFVKQLLESYTLKNKTSQRVLDRKETQYMLQHFVQEKKTRDVLLQLEQIDARYEDSVDFNQSYAVKLERLFYAYYSLQNTKPSTAANTAPSAAPNTATTPNATAGATPSTTPNTVPNTATTPSAESPFLTQLFADYGKFVHAHQCIDLFSFLWKLEQDPVDMQQSLVIVFPQNFACDFIHILSFLDAKKVINIRCYLENTCSIAEFLEQGRRAVQEKTQTLSYGSILEFNSIEEELNYVCRDIQASGLPAYETAISICNPSDIVLRDLQSIAQRYAVPISLPIKKRMPILTQLQELYENNFQVETLKHLFLDENIPWKQRATQIQILQLGFSSVLSDTKKLELWKQVLDADDFYRTKKTAAVQDLVDGQKQQTASEEELLEGQKQQSAAEYFFAFYKSTNAIVRAKSFPILRERLHEFQNQFLEKGDSALFCLQEMSEQLDRYVLLSRYLHKNHSQSTAEWHSTISPFQMLCNSLPHYTVKPAHNKNTIHVHTFPDSIGCQYKKHYFINFSQNNISQSLRNAEFFQEMLNAMYVTDELQQQYELRKHSLLQSMAECPSASISFSLQSYDGVQLEPVFWEREPYRNQNDDLWNKERLYWNDILSSSNENNTVSTFHLSEEQKKGLEYQQVLQPHRSPQSIFTHAMPHVTRDCFHHLLRSKDRGGVHTQIHPSKIYELIKKPLPFFFRNILSLKELFVVTDSVLSERMYFSTMLHKCFEFLALELSHLLLDKTLQTDEDVVLLVKDISQEVPRIQEKMQHYISHLPIHHSLRHNIHAAFDDLLLFRFLSVMIWYIRVFALRIRRIEEHVSFNLSSLKFEGKSFAPFILQGKPDLSFFDLQSKKHRFLDYKLRHDSTDERLAGNTAQLWAYNVLLNNDSSLIQDQGGKELFGGNYYIVESLIHQQLKDVVLPIPHIENKEEAEKTLSFIQEHLARHNEAWKKKEHICIVDQQDDAKKDKTLQKHLDQLMQYDRLIFKELFYATQNVYSLDFCTMPQGRDENNSIVGTGAGTDAGTGAVANSVADAVTDSVADSVAKTDATADAQEEDVLPETSYLDDFVLKSILRDECYMYENKG